MRNLCCSLISRLKTKEIMSKFIRYKHLFCKVSVCLFYTLLFGCGPKIDIDFPPPDALNSTYPIGIQNAQGTNAATLVNSRYESGKPIQLYLPAGDGPFPVVVFQHGRPFTMPSNYVYYPSRALVNATISQGFALAVVIRSGYFLASGPDEEIVPCNRPQFTDFVTAANAATADIVSATNYLSGLQIIDESLIVLAGSSAGGFAAMNALAKLDDQVSAAISINGGRCGSRGDAIGGLAWQRELYARVAANTSSKVYFLAGGNDDVIPIYSSRVLFMAFCRAREDCVKRDFTQQFTNMTATHDPATMVNIYSRALVDIVKN